MNNLLVGIKRFLGNKNTVTIIGVLAGIAVVGIINCIANPSI